MAPTPCGAGSRVRAGGNARRHGATRAARAGNAPRLTTGAPHPVLSSLLPSLPPRARAVARTALCMVAWGLTSASSVSRHAVGPAAEPGSLAATPKEGQAQPSLVGTLLARSL